MEEIFLTHKSVTNELKLTGSSTASCGESSAGASCSHTQVSGSLLEVRRAVDWCLGCCRVSAEMFLVHKRVWRPWRCRESSARWPRCGHNAGASCSHTQVSGSLLEVRRAVDWCLGCCRVSAEMFLVHKRVWRPWRCRGSSAPWPRCGHNAGASCSHTQGLLGARGSSNC